MKLRLLRPIVARPSFNEGNNNLARTLYYNNAESDNTWDTLGNWWDDASHTVPATSLPGPNDDVVVTANVFTISGGSTVIKNMTVDGAIFYCGWDFTCTGTATFINNAYCYTQGTETFATVIFEAPTRVNEGVLNAELLIVNGNWSNDGYFQLNGDLEANGTAIWGDGFFAGASGDATFNDSSRLGDNGSVSGTATFNDSSCVVSGGTAGTFVPNPPPSCP